jgi:hypothetical protein
MIPPIAAIRGMIVAAITLANDSDQHAQPNEQENDDVRSGSPSDSLLVAHPPRVQNETNSDGAE